MGLLPRDEFFAVRFLPREPVLSIITLDLLYTVFFIKAFLGCFSAAFKRAAFCFPSQLCGGLDERALDEARGTPRLSILGAGTHTTAQR